MSVMMSVPRSAAWIAALAGCAGVARTRPPDALAPALARAEAAPARAQPLDDAALVQGGALDRAAVVAAVLARNPDLDAARAAWRAQRAAYPAAVALDDPMARYAIAPASIGADVGLGHALEISQKLPWPGRRARRGDAAIANAEAAEADLEALRLEIAAAAVQAFDDDYLAARALEVNRHHRELLAQIERSAIAGYAAGRASQQDPLEAHTRILELDRERLVLETQQRAAVATLNRLLHRTQGADLPPPPEHLAAAPARAPRRDPPRQLAAAARVRARQAEADDAALAFYPSFEVMGSYSSMWDTWQHRWMIGVAVEIPLARGRRDAEVENARAEHARAVAELASLDAALAESRARADSDIAEANQALALYEQQLVPTLRQRVDAALAGFTAGQSPFSTVVTAERELGDAELAVLRTRAALDRGLAELDRLDGQVPGGAR